MSEDNGTRKPKRLSPSEVTDLFSGMSPERATRYLNRCLLNKETPTQNVDILLQYRDQNPEKFLDELPPRRRSVLGRGYDDEGRGRGGRIRILKDDSETESLFERMNPFRATRYARKVMSNPDTPEGNLRLVRKYVYDNPDRFLSDEQYEEALAEERRRGAERVRRGRPRDGYGGFDDDGYMRDTGLGYRSGGYDVGSGKKVYRPDYSGGYDMSSDRGYESRSGSERRFWSFLWKSKDEFDRMNPKEQKFFVRFFRNKTRTQNTAYGLRVMTNPETSRADKNAVAEVVNESPEMFLKGKQRRREFSDPKTDD